MLNCLIVDDEPLAREGIADYVSRTPFLGEVGRCADAEAALAVLEAGEVDLMLLDIHMPGLTGLDLLKSLRQPPLVILTTAYPSYALEGYALDVLDYLVKPITYPRFLQAAQKAREQFQLRQQARGPVNEPQKDHFFVKVDHRYEKIRLAEIRYVEGLQNYVALHTTRGRFITLMTLKKLEEALPTKDFLRIHKSYLVSLPQVDAVAGNEVFVGEDRLPVGRAYREEVQRVVQERLMGRE